MHQPEQKKAETWTHPPWTSIWCKSLIKRCRLMQTTLSNIRSTCLLLEMGPSTKSSSIISRHRQKRLSSQTTFLSFQQNRSSSTSSTINRWTTCTTDSRTTSSKLSTSSTRWVSLNSSWITSCLRRTSGTSKTALMSWLTTTSVWRDSVLIIRILPDQWTD